MLTIPKRDITPAPPTWRSNISKGNRAQTLQCCAHFCTNEALTFPILKNSKTFSGGGAGEMTLFHAWILDGHSQSLLEYKSANVKRQCRIFVKPWSDSIHIALWRNDGFLHSFHDFSKSNALSKNLIRMEFIPHNIFFRMSILSMRKILWMFFNLH